MNRREAITGVGAAVLAAVPMLANGEPNLGRTDQRINALGHFFPNASANQKTLTTVATVDDPDVQQILISVLVKEGRTQPLDSCVLERALLKHVGTNMFDWFKYCRDNGMKTL